MNDTRECWFAIVFVSFSVCVCNRNIAWASLTHVSLSSVCNTRWRETLFSFLLLFSFRVFIFATEEVKEFVCVRLKKFVDVVVGLVSCWALLIPTGRCRPRKGQRHSGQIASAKRSRFSVPRIDLLKYLTNSTHSEPITMRDQHFRESEASR